MYDAGRVSPLPGAGILITRNVPLKERHSMTMATQAERPGAITFKGGPMTLVGKELRVGDPLPEFHLQAAGTLETVGWNELSENGTKAV